ncbi:putative ribonuclease H-like domain-containing protein [Tanacetum coccineum]
MLLLVHISRLNPFGCAKLTTFVVMCKAYGCEPSVDLFLGFFNFCRAGKWLTFAKRFKKHIPNLFPKVLTRIEGWHKLFFYVRDSIIPAKYPQLLSEQNKLDLKSFKDKLPTYIEDNPMFQHLSRYPTSVRVFPDPILFLAGLKPSWEHEMAFKNFIYTEDDEDLAFLPKEPSPGFACSGYSEFWGSSKPELFVVHPGSVAARIKDRKVKTRGGSSRPPIKRKLASGSSTSRATHFKTSSSKDDAPFLIVSDDDEGLPNVFELKDVVACHLKISAITPPAWKNHLDNHMEFELLDIYDCCYARQVVVDNSVNRRSCELLQVIEKLRSECNVMRSKERAREEECEGLRVKCEAAMTEFEKNPTVVALREKIYVLSAEVKEHKLNLDRMMLDSQKWAGYQQSLSSLESKVTYLEAEKARLEAVEVSLRKEEVIVNGDSPLPKRIVDSVEQTYAPITAEEKLARKNELKARARKKMYEVIRSKETTEEHFLNSSMIIQMEKATKDLTRSMIGCKLISPTRVYIEKLFSRRCDLKLLKCDGFGYDWSNQAEEGPTNFALMAYTSLSSLSSDTEVSTCSKACLKSYGTLKEHYDNLKKDFNKSQLDVGAYKAGLESVKARLDVYKKNETIFEDDIKILKLNIMLRDNALTELRKKFEKAKKERDDLKLTLEKFENSSKNLSKLLDSQVSNKFKTGVGYDNQVFDSQVFSSQVNDSESVTSVPAVATSEVKTNKSKPKSISEPLIEDWISDSDNENETESKSRKRKHSNAKVKFVKSNEHVKSPRESVKKVEIDGGFVAFGGRTKGGKITGNGKIRTGKLDFEDVYFVKELKFNLFSVSQMCDKKNSVLFTDTECVVLSSDFKLTDENHVLLKVPRKDNMYSIDLRNVVPQGGLTCLFLKATLDESNLWHRRLGHINFKTMNKLVRGNLVRGLPSKIFENDHTCVACQKGKQHKASCKTKTVSSISQPLQMLHMDLFGLTFVKSIMKKMYCLVVTDDFSRFSWVFFLATKDETSGILKAFITRTENQINHGVKIIRCDNRTKFKNKEMNQFCEMKGIKREFSVARTPQQNRVAKRKNRTLIEAARTMLADSKLPTTFWAEAVENLP